jgi:CRP-like cAMP-binding protein
VPTTELSEALLEGMARTPLFEGASDETISRLAAQGVTRRFRRGTYLFHQGDDAPDVYFLVGGRVEISSLSSNGHRQLHTTLDVPQFFGELGVLGDQPRSAAALALEDTEAWRVSGPVLLDFLIEEPTAARALLRALARQVLSQERSSKTCCTWT